MSTKQYLLILACSQRKLHNIEVVKEMFLRSQIIFAQGRIGERLKQLKNWLEEKSMD